MKQDLEAFHKDLLQLIEDFGPDHQYGIATSDLADLVERILANRDMNQMTKREQFAAQMMAGLLSCEEVRIDDKLAGNAVRCADMLLDELAAAAYDAEFQS